MQIQLNIHARRDCKRAAVARLKARGDLTHVGAREGTLIVATAAVEGEDAAIELIAEIWTKTVGVTAATWSSV